jgi:hypothetical protein
MHKLLPITKLCCPGISKSVEPSGEPEPGRFRCGFGSAHDADLEALTQKLQDGARSLNQFHGVQRLKKAANEALAEITNWKAA